MYIYQLPVILIALLQVDLINVVYLTASFHGKAPILQRDYNNHPHEFPCRIEISHPRGRNFNQGRGLPSPRLNSDPKGEISLSYMDRLMIDCFSPTFPRFFVGT